MCYFIKFYTLSKYSSIFSKDRTSKVILTLLFHYNKSRDVNNVICLNPEPMGLEWVPWTRKVLSSFIPTFDLTIEGVEQAMDYLRKGGKNVYTTVNQLKGLAY